MYEKIKYEKMDGILYLNINNNDKIGPQVTGDAS